MIALLNRILRRQDRENQPRLEPGLLVYGIGDIHGRHDLLGDLLEQIGEDRARREASKTVIVFLGDLIDRGPASAEVVERLRTYSPEGVQLVFLAGNHEEVLLRILEGDDSLIANWFKFGGLQCCESYGVDVDQLTRMTFREAGNVIRAAIPAVHRNFLASFGDTLRVGQYLFVHAGIRPGIALAAQAQSDLRWIRQPFLDDDRDHGFIVIHGHTITDFIDQAENRIGIDTGAYRSGVLTALGAAGDSTWFLNTDNQEVDCAIKRSIIAEEAEALDYGVNAAFRAEGWLR